MQATGQRDTYALFQFFSEPCEDMVFLSERQGLRNRSHQEKLEKSSPRQILPVNLDLASRGGPSLLKQSIDVLADEVGFEIDGIACPFDAKCCELCSMRNDRHPKPLGRKLVDCQAHPIHRDRAFRHA